MNIFNPRTLATMSWKQLINSYEVACFQAGRTPSPDNIKAVNDLRAELLARVRAVNAMTKV